MQNNNFINFIREWKEKYDLVDDAKDDTLTYHYKNTFIFRKDLSGPGLTGDEIITMPHPRKLYCACFLNQLKENSFLIWKKLIISSYYAYGISGECG